MEYSADKGIISGYHDDDSDDFQSIDSDIVDMSTDLEESKAHCHDLKYVQDIHRMEKDFYSRQNSRDKKMEVSACRGAMGIIPEEPVYVPEYPTTPTKEERTEQLVVVMTTSNEIDTLFDEDDFEIQGTDIKAHMEDTTDTAVVSKIYEKDAAINHLDDDIWTDVVKIKKTISGSQLTESVLDDWEYCENSTSLNLEKHSEEPVCGTTGRDLDSYVCENNLKAVEPDNVDLYERGEERVNIVQEEEDKKAIDKQVMSELYALITEFQELVKSESPPNDKDSESYKGVINQLNEAAIMMVQQNPTGEEPVFLETPTVKYVPLDSNQPVEKRMVKKRVKVKRKHPRTVPFIAKIENQISDEMKMRIAINENRLSRVMYGYRLMVNDCDSQYLIIPEAKNKLPNDSYGA